MSLDLYMHHFFVVMIHDGFTLSSVSPVSFLRPTLVREIPLSTSAPRGEGVQKSADFADKQSYRSADKGGRGSKNPKILWTYLMEAPYVEKGC